MVKGFIEWLKEEFSSVGVAPEGNIGGMGEVSAPTDSNTGSGDAWPSLGQPSSLSPLHTGAFSKKSKKPGKHVVIQGKEVKIKKHKKTEKDSLLKFDGILLSTGKKVGVKYDRASNSYVFESERVKLDRELREYNLTHVKDSIFQLRSDDYYREFSVTPYNKKDVGKFKEIHQKLSKALEDQVPEQLLTAIKFSEKLYYDYGNLFTGEFTFVGVPEIALEIQDDQKEALKSEKDFIANVYPSLNKDAKQEVMKAMEERAELTLCVIEALFYFIRTEDKESFYEGKSREEIIEEYEEAVKKAKKEVTFSFEGPFSDVDNSKVDENTSKAFWYCEKDRKKFFIRGTVSPEELYSEEEIGDGEGLRLSLVTPENLTPEKDFSYFPIDELGQKIERFYNKKLKK
jgi:hypothetical protein